MPPNEIPQVRRLMSNDERIGMGFNSESGLAVGTPFEMDDLIVEADPDAPGMVVFSTITLVNSHDELMESLGLDIQAQGRYGFFSADAKAKYAETARYNSTSTFLIAKVTVENPFKRGREFHLTEQADPLTAPGQQETFKGAFGDSFVRGIQTGGEFYSVIRITSISTAAQTDLALELQAEYQGLVTAGSFELKFTKANLSESTRSEFSATMFQRAGNGDESSPTVTLEDVMQRVKKFPSIVEANPVAYEIEVATYDTLALPFPTPEEEENFALSLSDARSKKLRYIQTRNDLEFARQHPEFFQDLPPDAVLLEAIAAYTQLINGVMTHGIELSTGRMRPPTFFDPLKLGLAEPAPIPLKRAPGPPPGTVRVPDLASIDFFTLADYQICLAHGGGVAGCLDGTAFPGQDEIPTPLNVPRDIAEFLQLQFSGGLKFKWVPGDPSDIMTSLPGPSTFAVSQSPPPGTEIPLGSEVIVAVQVTPE